MRFVGAFFVLFIYRLSISHGFTGWRLAAGRSRCRSLRMSEKGDADIMKPRSFTPRPRQDTFKTIFSGIIGTDPKEAYLANGHYVVSFSLAVVGHFAAIHEGEKQKTTETMWVNVELWDDEARSKLPSLRKGAPLAGLGTLIFNKWIDKNTGEERKQFKMRMFRVLSSEAMSEILDVTNKYEAGPGQEEVFVNDPSMEWFSSPFEEVDAVAVWGANTKTSTNDNTNINQLNQRRGASRLNDLNNNNSNNNIDSGNNSNINITRNTNRGAIVRANTKKTEEEDDFSDFFSDSIPF